MAHPPHLVKYVPEWFPGAGFKTFAREARDQFNLAVDGPLAYVKQSLEVCRYLKYRTLLMPELILVGASLVVAMRLLLLVVLIAWLSLRIKGLMRVPFDR